VRALNAEIATLNHTAKAAKGDKVPALCLELVKVNCADIHGPALGPFFLGCIFAHVRTRLVHVGQRSWDQARDSFLSRSTAHALLGRVISGSSGTA
jgi:hypothetical protein